MTKEDIINEYIPFMVKEMLKKAKPPKGEKKLIEYSQTLGKELLDRIMFDAKIITESEQKAKDRSNIKQSTRLN